jgi:hypothetical protein
MSRLKKLNTFFITLLLSHSATAVIVQGSVSDNATESHSTILTQAPAQLNGVKHVDQQSTNYNATFSSDHRLALAFEAQTTPAGSLLQNLSMIPPSTVYDNVVSYAGLEAVGVASRADYHGWMAVNLGVIRVDAEEAVTVPEPSSLLLLIGPLLLLFWRIDTRSGIFRKNAN